MDDRQWMYTGRTSHKDISPEWIEKTEAFLEEAFNMAKGARTTWCPCGNCANMRKRTKEVMVQHLCKYGFTKDYTRWTYHGEADRTREEVVRPRVEGAMKTGGGKKHGRYWIGDSTIDSTSTPTLTQIKAKRRRRGQSAGIRPRPTASYCQLQAMQVQIQERDQQIRDLKERYSQMALYVQSMALYVQSLGAQMGRPPPPVFFVPHPPPGPTHSESAGSN